MKRIKKTLMTGLLACTAFNAQNAQAEVSPFGYGVKGFGGLSSPVRYSENAKIDAKAVESSFFSPMNFGVGLYGEYACTDYIGVELEASYMREQVGLTGKKDDKADNNSSTVPSVSMISHGVIVPIHLSIYPFGRAEAEGILKINLGIAGYIPYARTYKKGDKEENLSEEQKKEKPSFDIAASASIGYECPFGLFAELRYIHGIMNRFKTEGNKSQTIFSNVTDLKELHAQSLSLGLGYNFASLFSE